MVMMALLVQDLVQYFLNPSYLRQSSQGTFYRTLRSSFRLSYSFCWKTVPHACYKHFADQDVQVDLFEFLHAGMME